MVREINSQKSVCRTKIICGINPVILILISSNLKALAGVAKRYIHYFILTGVKNKQTKNTASLVW